MIDYNDQPEQSYFPAAKARLIVRLEEFNRGELQAAPPAKTTKNLKGTSVNRAELVVETEQDAAGRRRLVLRGAATNAVTGAPSPSAAAKDILKRTFTIGGIVPVSASLKRSARTADTLQISFLFSDLPLDPRCIRSAAIEFFIGTVSADDATAGNEGLTRETAPGVVEPMNMIPDSFPHPETGRSVSTRRFAGWVDKWRVTTADDIPVVVMECRSNFALLDAQVAPPNLRIDPKLPIDQAFAQYLAHFPQMEGLSVQHLPADVTPPTLESTRAKGSFPPNFGPAPSGGGGATGTDNVKVIDYLTTMAGALGYVVRVVLDTVVVQPASGLVSGRKASREDDPFQGRTLASGEILQHRTLIYGGNIESQDVERSWAHAEPKNVEVRCYQPARKSVLVARYPDKAARVVAAMPGGKEEHEWHIQRLPAGSVSDPKVLLSAAKSLFEAMNRMQLTSNFRTSALASWGGSNRLPDLIFAEPGDAFEVRNANLVVDTPIPSGDDVVRYMTARGFDTDFARAYADARANSAVQKVYVLREIVISWGIDTGIEISGQLATYVEARVDADDPGLNPGF